MATDEDLGQAPLELATATAPSARPGSVGEQERTEAELATYGRDGLAAAWAWRSVALTLGLVVALAVVGYASGSLAVVAEMVHNIVDLVSAIAVVVGLRWAGRTTERFPYGLYKLENVVAAGLAGLVFLTAYEITRQAISGGASLVSTEPWMLAAVAGATVVPLVYGHLELQAARAGNSPALTAQAREYRVHVATSGVVFGALLAYRVDFPVERVAAGIIVVVVARTGWSLLVDAVRVLLDATVDPGTLARVSETVRADPAVMELKWITARNAGRVRFVEAGVVLRVSSLDVAAATVGRIEAALRQSVPNIERVVVQVEPPFASAGAEPAPGLSGHSNAERCRS